MTAEQPVRVLLIDDSEFVCNLMAGWIRAEHGLEVVATARDGYQGFGLIQWLKPDVVTLDLEMPDMNGLETLRHIMTDCPTPVVVVTGVSRGAAAAVENAFALGAVDFAFKYQPGSVPAPDVFRQDICAKIKAAATTPVTRLQSNGMSPARTSLHWSPQEDTNALNSLAEDVVVVGASTGGIEALQRLLGSLPADYSAGIVVVQHIPAEFSSVVASQISERSLLPVREAQEGDPIPRGVVLVAPGDSHLLVGPDRRVSLDGSPPIRGHRPCIDVTMQAIAAMYRRRTMGVLLTGEGDDGTQGLAAVQAAGGKTFAQSPESCVVPAMALRAIERGVVDHVGTPEALGMQLKVLT